MFHVSCTHPPLYGYHFKFITVQPNCVRRIAWTNNSLLHPRQDNGRMDPMTFANIVNLLHLARFEFAIKFNIEKNSLWNKHVYIYIERERKYCKFIYPRAIEGRCFQIAIAIVWRLHEIFINIHCFLGSLLFAIYFFFSVLWNDCYNLTIVHNEKWKHVRLTIREWNNFCGIYNSISEEWIRLRGNKISMGFDISKLYLVQRLSLRWIRWTSYWNKLHINIIFIVRERFEYVIAEPKR